MDAWTDSRGDPYQFFEDVLHTTAKAGVGNGPLSFAPRCAKTADMSGDEIPRRLPARTGKTLCTRCLREIPPAEYFRYDYVCAECASREEFPLRSTDGTAAGGEPLGAGDE